MTVDDQEGFGSSVVRARTASAFWPEGRQDQSARLTRRLSVDRLVAATVR